MLVHSEQGDAFTFAEIRAWLEEARFCERPVARSSSPLAARARDQTVMKYPRGADLDFAPPLPP